MYLELKHGRNRPDEKADEVGFEGPIIGPLETVSCVYGGPLRIALREEDGDPVVVCLPMQEGMVVWEGETVAYFGEWWVVSSLAGDEKPVSHEVVKKVAYKTPGHGSKKRLGMSDSDPEDIFDGMAISEEGDGPRIDEEQAKSFLNGVGAGLTCEGHLIAQRAHKSSLVEDCVELEMRGRDGTNYVVGLHLPTRHVEVVAFGGRHVDPWDKEILAFGLPDELDAGVSKEACILISETHKRKSYE